LDLVKNSRGDSSGMQPHYLDEDEVKEYGSHCLDGSVPIFHFKEGTADGKWVIWLKGGGYCTDETDCSETEVSEPNKEMDEAPIQTYGEFNTYHHVQINNCDDGLYMGNTSQSYDASGKTLYFQGSRIIQHVIDTLNKNYSMTDVMFAGGSGGGQSLLAGGDNIASMMPSTVERFGVVPMNGWYTQTTDNETKTAFALHGMGASSPPKCIEMHDSESEWECVKPEVTYRYNQVNTFVVQLFDETFKWVDPYVYQNWRNCLDLDSAPTPECTDEAAANVSSFWAAYVESFSERSKYNSSGQGGFLSTCGHHQFYNTEEEFSSFNNDGVTVGEAVWKWWESLNSDAPAVWYLPCEMGTTVETLQCDSTC